MTCRAAYHLTGFAVTLCRYRAGVDYVNAALLGKFSDSEAVFFKFFGNCRAFVLVNLAAECHYADPALYFVVYFEHLWIP